MIKVQALCEKPCFLSEIVERLWEHWHHDFEKVPKHQTKELLKAYYSDCKNVYIVRANVYIVPEYRKRGFVATLLHHVQKQYQRLHLWAYDKDLARLYEKTGFVTKGIVAAHAGHKNIVYMVWERAENRNE